MTNASTGYRDVLDPSRDQELERLHVLQHACDPASIRWLQHLRERAAVLSKLVAALRPGGWLLVEEADYVALDASIGDMPAPVVTWYREVQRVLRERLHIDNYAGRRAAADLLATELTGVGSDGCVFLLGPTAPAVSPEFVAGAFEQALPMLERHGLGRAEGEAFVQWMRRPDFSAFGPIQMATWGQRPHAAASPIRA